MAYLTVEQIKARAAGLQYPEVYITIMNELNRWIKQSIYHDRRLISHDEQEAYVLPGDTVVRITKGNGSELLVDVLDPVHKDVPNPKAFWTTYAVHDTAGYLSFNEWLYNSQTDWN